MAKANYQFEKRQRDLAKKNKQEEKRRQKLASKAAAHDNVSQVTADTSEATAADAAGTAVEVPEGEAKPDA